MSTDSPLIEVNRLVRKFGDRTVLNDISFNVHPGDTLVIMGGSGCGKSTLLRHLIGAMKPTSGTVKLFGEEVTGMKEREILRIRRISRSFIPVTSSPKSFTVPEVGFMAPIRCRSNVLLPQPLPPMITSVSPG